MVLLYVHSFSCGVLEATGRVECWGEGALGDAPSLDVLEGKLMDEVSDDRHVLICSDLCSHVRYFHV